MISCAINVSGEVKRNYEVKRKYIENDNNNIWSMKAVITERMMSKIYKNHVMHFLLSGVIFKLR